MILLDTTVVSDGLKPRPNPNVETWLDDHESAPLWISSITIAELRLGVELMPDGRKKSAIGVGVQRAIDEFRGNCLAFDALAADAFARVVAQRRAAGRPIQPLDAQIAAIALSAGFAVATLNVGDFDGIDGLRVVDPSA